VIDPHHLLKLLLNLINIGTAKRYIDILEDNLWPVIARHFPENNCIFQDDNAPVYRARSVMEYRLKNKIDINLVAQSPDLNIIENVWHRLKRQLQNEVDCIATDDDLKSKIRLIWQSLPINYIQNLYHSIP